ncbi:MAG: winged helix-turn-helix transcriptional regulator [Phycisphaerales bacterium]
MAPVSIDPDSEVGADLPDLRPLVRLCTHRWSVPALGDLYRLRGAKFVTLTNRLGVSRESLSRTLDDLQALDLVMRNPGYGHPMRPEYLLTPDGESVAPAALATVEAIPVACQGACRRKWALGVLAALSSGLERFRDIAAALEGVTPRALTMTLEELEGAAIVHRRMTTGRRPRPVYEPSATGRVVGDRAIDLATALSFDA